jgi:redox-sensitive bicupin YhaK (pirin superfamily)
LKQMDNNEQQTSFRKVQKIVRAKEADEGQGARVKRSIGSGKLSELDPFLLLDEAFIQPPAGFPDHPHRGFETVTYMLAGTIMHKDNKGHAGTIGPGAVQWMTAGRGIIHSEMPGSSELAHGLQLWVNLSRKNKMCDPEYQELSADQIPEGTAEGVKVRIIAGESCGKKAEVRTRTPAIYLDFHMTAGARFEQEIPANLQTAFVYVLSGTGEFGEPASEGGEADLLVFETQGKLLRIKALTDLRFILVAGEPIGEPIARYGPFVMNTRQELQEAMIDFQLGRF